MQPQENALRSLIVFYNKLYYSAHLAPQHSPDPGHRRSDSTSAVVLDDPALRPSHEPRSASSSTSESDVFPPRKTDASQLPYNPDGMIEFWLHEYEDVLLEVFGDGEDGHDPWDVPLHDHRPLSVDGQGPSSPSLAGPRISRAPGAAERDDATWLTLGEIMRSKGGAEDDGISDSESVVTVGELGDDARMDDGKDDGEGEEEGIFSRQQRMPQQGENTWEVGIPQCLVAVSITDRALVAHVTHHTFSPPTFATRTPSFLKRQDGLSIIEPIFADIAFWQKTVLRNGFALETRHAPLGRSRWR